MEVGDFSRFYGSDILLQIVSLLDLRSILRLRCVCKSWCEVISSPLFDQHWKKNPLSRQVWAVLRVRTDPPSSVDEERDFYHQCDEVPNHLELWCPPSVTRFVCKLPMEGKFLGWRSSEGLVCGQIVTTDRSLSLVVGNPVTNKWKVLPAVAVVMNYVSEIIIQTDHIGQYIIVVIFIREMNAGDLEDSEDEESIYDVMEYDSRSQAWNLHPKAASINENDNFQGSMLGTRSLSGPGLGYDASEDQDEFWKASRCGFRGSFIHKGRIFAGVDIFIHTQDKFQMLGLGIWELEQSKKNWKMLCRVRFKDLYGEGWGTDQADVTWKLQLVGEFVIFSSMYKPWTHGLCPPVAYHLGDSRWHSSLSSAEKCGLSFFQTIDYECSYAFIPSLMAHP